MQAVTSVKRKINELIVREQAKEIITDQYINQLSQADIEELTALQRKLTVIIRLDRGAEDQKPKIHLEGLTRDVFTAKATVRSANSVHIYSIHKHVMMDVQCRVLNMNMLSFTDHYLQ